MLAAAPGAFTADRQTRTRTRCGVTRDASTLVGLGAWRIRRTVRDPHLGVADQRRQAIIPRADVTRAHPSRTPQGRHVTTSLCRASDGQRQSGIPGKLERALRQFLRKVQRGLNPASQDSHELDSSDRPGQRRRQVSPWGVVPCLLETQVVAVDFRTGHELAGACSR